VFFVLIGRRSKKLASVEEEREGPRDEAAHA
jgi:hypothetical protein